MGTPRAVKRKLDLPVVGEATHVALAIRVDHLRGRQRHEVVVPAPGSSGRGTLGEHSGNIRGTFHQENFQGTLNVPSRECSGNGEGTLKEHPVKGILREV
jgi:hypothetical protein